MNSMNTNAPAECIHAVGACSISISAPEGSQAYKTGERGGMYSFSRVSGPTTTQANFFEGTTAPLVRAMVSGRQSENVIMSYGVTSSGKTYTIEGTQQAPGLIYRAVATLFKELDEQQKVGAEVFVSHYEVYNEQIFDLLTNANPIGGRRCLQLKEDAAGRPTIVGLTDVRVPTAEAAMETLRRGNANRSRAETTLNFSSSRSHSVFAVTLQTPATAVNNDGDHIAKSSTVGGAGVPGVAFRLSQQQQQQQQQQQAGRGAVSTSVLHFVDLAGSERARRTGNVGERLKEATAINSSLMCLGRCLEALRWNQKHGDKRPPRRVPYRESKITHLFKSALHGWGRIMLIVNVSAAAADYDETIHVLKYAALATQISTAARVELVQPPPAPVVGRELAAKRRKTAAGGAVAVAHSTGTMAGAGAVKLSAALAANVTTSRGARGGGRCRRGRRSRAISGIGLDGIVHGGIAEEEEEGEDEDGTSSGDEEEEEDSARVAEGRNPNAAVIAKPGGGFDDDEEDDDDGDDDDDDDDQGLDDEEDWAQEREALLQDIEEMRAQMFELERKNAAIETDVREEVSAEMAELLKEMEAAFQAKLEAHKKAAAAAVAQAEVAVISGGGSGGVGGASGGGRGGGDDSFEGGDVGASGGSRGGKTPRRSKSAKADATRIRELEELLAAATAARDEAEAARDREAAAAAEARSQATTLTRQLSELSIKAAEVDELRAQLEERTKAAAEAEMAATEAEAAAARATQEKETAVAAERAAAAAAAAAAAIVTANEKAAALATSPSALALTAALDAPMADAGGAGEAIPAVQDTSMEMEADAPPAAAGRRHSRRNSALPMSTSDPEAKKAAPALRRSRRNSGMHVDSSAGVGSSRAPTVMAIAEEQPEEDAKQNEDKRAEDTEQEEATAEDSIAPLPSRGSKKVAPPQRRSRRTSTQPTAAAVAAASKEKEEEDGPRVEISADHTALVADSVKYFESTPLKARADEREAEEVAAAAAVVVAAANEEEKPAASRRRSRRSSAAHHGSLAGKDGQKGKSPVDKENTAVFNDDKGKDAEKKPRIESICEEEEEGAADMEATVVAKVAGAAGATTKAKGGALRSVQKDAAGGIVGKTPIARRTRGGLSRA